MVKLPWKRLICKDILHKKDYVAMDDGDDGFVLCNNG